MVFWYTKTIERVREVLPARELETGYTPSPDELGKNIVEQYTTGIAFPCMTIACFLVAGMLQTVTGIFIVYYLSASIGLLIGAAWRPDRRNGPC